MSDPAFDERIASQYEALWPEIHDPAVIGPAVDFLAALAGDGSVLELGIGTGRLALPLADRGVRVHGIELSAAMITEFRKRHGADRIGVTMGDFARASVDERFGLAYLVRNTITNVTTQADQVAVFRNAAAHLEPGGSFVIENYVPALQRLPPGETIHAFEVTPTHVGFEEYDIANQIAISHHYWFHDGETTTYSTPHRYVWPGELDLMAELAGLTLQDRWADWDRSPFTSESRSHISVWTLPG